MSVPSTGDCSRLLEGGDYQPEQFVESKFNQYHAIKEEFLKFKIR